MITDGLVGADEWASFIRVYPSSEYWHLGTKVHCQLSDMPYHEMSGSNLLTGNKYIRSCARYRQHRRIHYSQGPGEDQTTRIPRVGNQPGRSCTPPDAPPYEKLGTSPHNEGSKKLNARTGKTRVSPSAPCSAYERALTYLVSMDVLVVP